MLNFYNSNDEIYQLAKDIYSATLNYFSQKDIFEVEAEIIMAEEIQAINLEARGVDSVTDVLSFPSLEISKLPVSKKDFPFDINPDTGCIMLGELVMCMERIREQAEDFGHSITRETGYLFLHGLLHLLGFDHINEDDKVVMRKHEEAILSALNINR